MLVDKFNQKQDMAKIAHITDLHADEKFAQDYGVDAWKNWTTILEDVNKRGIREVVFAGDIGSEASNQYFFDSLKAFDFNFRLTLGNHDTFSSASKYYHPDIPEERKELYHSEDFASYKAIYLDSSTNAISEDQLEWFLQELKTDKSIVLYVHHPILETHSTPQREYPLDGEQVIREALLAIDNRVNIFCGHLHIDDSRSERNVTQTVTPAASFQITRSGKTSEVDNITFGYNIVELHGNEILSTAVKFGSNQEILL